MTKELNDDQIREIARLCHAANRELQYIQNDPNPSETWFHTSEEIKASAIDGVKKALAGATSEELHDSWCEFKLENGWRYGPVKDAVKKTHPSLVGYPSLPLSERLKDYLFNSIVRGYAAANGVDIPKVVA